MRPVELRDVPALVADCWADHSEKHAQQHIRRIQYFAQRQRGLGIVVTDGVQIIGYGQIIIWKHCGEISDLIVSATQRNQGIGTAMIQHLMQAGRAMGITCFEIGAAVSNPRALALYRRLGFVDAYQRSLDLGAGVETVIYLRRSG